MRPFYNDGVGHETDDSALQPESRTLLEFAHEERGDMNARKENRFEKRRQFREREWMWIAEHLPKPLVYWCLIRAGVKATTGPWSSQDVAELSFADVLKRWTEDDASSSV